ncbi:MAG: 4-hydroxy-3-methylbut-2-enyl diphosphate reductase, partial [Myxococcales bacterium]|nr:4-hydroxy-3-methylbut-2-enyl diphosphate reductase [Myxococcales bacterium]
MKTAVDTAFEAADGAAFVPVQTLGPIIHNSQVVDRLDARGVRAVNHLDEVTAGKVIIRAHGVPREEKAAALARGVDVIDATCSDVVTVHQFAEQLDRDGFFVVVVGNKDHPEVRGILSYGTPGAIACVKDAREALALKRRRKVGVVSQTTETAENFAEVVAVLARRTP